MTRALTIGVMLAALAAPAALSAQTPAKPVTFGVSGGLSLPTGEFGEARNTGYTLAGHAYFKPASLSTVRLRGDVAYDDWDLKEFDSKTRTIAVVGNVVYDFPAQSTSIVHPDIRAWRVPGLCRSSVHGAPDHSGDGLTATTKYSVSPKHDVGTPTCC